MKKQLASFGLLLPLVACLASPSEQEQQGSGSSAVSVVAGEDAGTAAILGCLGLGDPTPTNPVPKSGGAWYTCAPPPDGGETSISIAPGQTDADLEIEVGTSWPNPAQVYLSISGLPADVTAAWTQTIGYIPPDQGIAGHFSFSASPTTPPGTTQVTVTAKSGSASGSATFALVVAGTCVPATCAGRCGILPNDCGALLSCGPCKPTPTCPTGTHDCGSGICAKVCE